MTQYYQNQTKLYVGVDCIIFGYIHNQLCILLIKRQFNPGKGEWSLMGGFVEAGESVDDAAKHVLESLTGLNDVYMEQVGAFGEPDRDPGERVVSVVYYALLGASQFDPARLAEHNAFWVALSQVPPLLFDHGKMVEKALQLLRKKVITEPIGFNLLPEKFSLTQLQQLYEAILDEPLDKRNFRKQVAKMDCIESTGQIDKERSRRGALLYKFNDNVYRHSYKKFKL